MTNHRLLLDKTNKWEQLLQLPHRYVPFGNQHWSVSTAIHVQPSTSRSMRSELGNQTTPVSMPSIMEVFVLLEIQSVFIVFFAIYPKLLNIFYLYSVAYIPQEYLPLTFKPFHHGPYQDP